MCFLYHYWIFNKSNTECSSTRPTYIFSAWISSFIWTIKSYLGSHIVTLKCDLWPWKYIGFFLFPYQVYILSLSSLGWIVLAISCPQGSKCQNSLKRPSDLEMWPLTLKINRILPLSIWSIRTKFEQPSLYSSCYILPTRIQVQEFL